MIAGTVRGGAARARAPLRWVALALALLAALSGPALAKPESGSLEPGAGAWKTWVLSSGDQLRPGPPPDRPATLAELQELGQLAGRRDAAALNQIAYWDAGAPGYRWNELLFDISTRQNYSTNRTVRALALLNVAIYDATVAAWDAKYAYDRPRPAQSDHRLVTALPTPNSPSYPSEHAVAAGAAASVLAYIFPGEAQAIEAKAAEAGRSRVLAGVQYPSDVAAGLELGRQVAALAIERAKQDGSDAKWTGSAPTGPGYWTGASPDGVTTGGWKTWVLTSGSQFRPGPPPAYDSVQRATELAEVKNFQRTATTNRLAMFYQYPSASPAGIVPFWNGMLERKLAEYRLDLNPPRAARAYALAGVAAYDGMVSCYDAKYTYWTARPDQFDPTIKTLFANPSHPSYPSGHSCRSAAVAGVLSHLFPAEDAALRATVDEIAASRLAAGIHFRSDLVVGKALGYSTAQAVVERAAADGAE